MKKFFIALAIILGIGIVALGVAAVLYKTGTVNVNETFEAKSVTENNEVNSVSVEIATDRVEFLPSEDGKLKIDYFDSDKRHYDSSYSDGTATFAYKQKSIFSFFFLRETKDVKIYLPDTVNGTVNITVASGEITENVNGFNVKNM